MKKLLALIGSLFLVTVITVTAYASIPAPNGTINGCYTTQAVNGLHGLGVVDSTGSCPTGTTSLNWNQTGPQGPQGPAGISGKNFHSSSTVDVVPGQWVTIAGGSGFIESFSTAEMVRISFTTQTAGHQDWYRILVDNVAIPATTQITNASGPQDGTILFYSNSESIDSWEYAVNLASGTHSFEIDIWIDTPERFFGPVSMSVEALGS